MSSSARWSKTVQMLVSGDFDERMLTHAPSLHYKSPLGSTFLHLAILGGNPRTVLFLLQAGLSPETTNIYGETPLHWACRIASVEVINLLLRKGANVNDVDGEGETPLHWALSANRHNVVKILLREGALQLANYDMQTPIDMARESRSYKSAALLFLHRQGRRRSAPAS
jgi:ankyrin repeat protein